MHHESVLFYIPQMINDRVRLWDAYLTGLKTNVVNRKVFKSSRASMTRKQLQSQNLRSTYSELPGIRQNCSLIWSVCSMYSNGIFTDTISQTWNCIYFHWEISIFNAAVFTLLGAVSTGLLTSLLTSFDYVWWFLTFFNKIKETRSDSRCPRLMLLIF